MQQRNLQLQGASNLTLSETQNGDVSEETMGDGKVKKSRHSMNVGLSEAQSGDVSQEAKSTVLTNGEAAMQSPNPESKMKKKKRKMMNDAGPDTKRKESQEESAETPKETENNVEKPDNDEGDSEVPSLPLGLAGAFEYTSLASLYNLVNENTLKAIKEMDFTNMTEIHHKSIRPLLESRDRLAAAKTGSGKTLDFLIPAVELMVKLKFMPRNGMGVLILSPVRELTMQIFGGRAYLWVDNGWDNRSAEAQKLANGINITVATPGHLLDHMQNNPGFMYKNLQCLVIDEADHILDVGFEEELKQIIKLLPTHRQTMIFSATQTQKVEDLARISLKKVPLYVGDDGDNANETVCGLEQGYVVCPYEEIPSKKLMVFFSSCMSMKYHYELPNYIDLLMLAIHEKQKQNKHTTTFFQFSNADFGTLLCTDVAARGLDITEVDWIVQPKWERKLGFLCYLKQSKIPLSEFDFSWSKISDIQSQLEKLIKKNYFLHKSSYIQAYDSHSLKQIFNVNNLNFSQVALSFAFKVPPFIDLKLKSNEGKQKKQGGGAEKSKIFKHISKKSPDSRQFSN
uniref:ATP-dependent RNA helicase n=1 Tax=Nomascus leucogenys TaxID=61853 RepID=A0A2I3GDQ5_NOMLE